MHLGSVKRICSNSWALESWDLISNIDFEKLPLGFFPYRAYVFHENDSANLTKKSSGLLKDGSQSVYLISLVFSIHERPQASIAAIFRPYAGYLY